MRAARTFTLGLCSSFVPCRHVRLLLPELLIRPHPDLRTNSALRYRFWYIPGFSTVVQVTFWTNHSLSLGAVLCTDLYSIPDLYPLDASHNPCPSHGSRKRMQMLADAPEDGARADSPQWSITSISSRGLFR